MTTKITKRQFEVAKMFQEALAGDLFAQNRFIEAISTSDVPVQMTPTLLRIALNNYADQPKIWQNWAARETVPSFESHPYYNFQWDDNYVEPANGGVDFVHGGLAHIPELDEYPVLNFRAGEQSLKTRKNGVQIRYSWESLILTRNFDLLNKTFAEFGKRSSVTEDVEATRPLVVAGGVNATNFNSTNQNVATGAANAPLSQAALEAAFEQIATQTYNGRAVSASGGYALVVPPALVPTAERIKGTLAIKQTETVGNVVTEYQVTNTLAGKFDIVENPYLVDIAGSVANTYWFLIPKPGTTPNPSVVNVFLQGHETPSVFVRSTTTSAPQEGDFLDDSYATKARHVVAGGFILPQGTLFSDGVA